jgi:hypothetical protein
MLKQWSLQNSTNYLGCCNQLGGAVEIKKIFEDDKLEFNSLCA